MNFCSHSQTKREPPTGCHSYKMFSKIFAVFNQPPADPYAKDFPLLANAWPVTLLAISYILFVLKLGKVFMQNRQPYNIKNVMIIYNLCQVVYNAVLFGFIFYYTIIKQVYDLRCMVTLPLDDPQKNIERYLSYAYFFNKIIDLLDTIFFVLRKSYKQITVLHVYHHIIMVYITYWVIKIFGFGGQFVVMAALNTLVHSVMYFYYLISAKYSGLKGSPWWKKYITKIQLIQFVLVLLQANWVLFFNPECQAPKAILCLLVIFGIIFLLMFGNFYIQTYVKKPKQQKQQ